MELKKKTNPLIILQAILAVLGVAVDVYALIVRGPKADTIVPLAVYAIVLFYAWFGYKKTGGNMFKFTLLLFAMFTAATASVDAFTSAAADCLVIAAAVFAGYISGRLDMFTQNRILMIFVGILLAAAAAADMIGMAGSGYPVIVTIARLTVLIQWVVIAIAYLVRFRETRAAGLMDER